MVVIIPLSKRGKHAGKYEALVDDEFAHLAELNWAVELDDSRVYARRKIYIGEGSSRRPFTLRLHRAVMASVLGRELFEHEYVDHANGNCLDNRRENLRLATNAENQRNRKRVRNSISGFKGVAPHRRKWVAAIRHNGKQLYLGLYNTPEEAHEAYCEKAKELFGEFFRAA